MLNKSRTNTLGKVESVNCRKSTYFVHTLYGWQRLLIGDDYTEDEVLYMAFVTDQGIQWLQ